MGREQGESASLDIVMIRDEPLHGGEVGCCTRCEAWMGFSAMDSSRLHTSLLLSQQTLAIWRAVVLAFCLCTSVVGWSVDLDKGEPAKRYIFLTIWSFDLLTTYFGLALWCTLDGMCLQRGERLQWTVKTRTTAVLFQLAVPVAFTVSMFYWLLLAGDMRPSSPRSEFTNPVVHAANSGFVVVELLVSRNVFHRRHFFVVPLYALTYIAWSAAYTLGANTIIYPILTYRDAWTAVWILLCLAFAFVCFPLGHAATRCRDRCLAQRSLAGQGAHAAFLDVGAADSAPHSRAPESDAA